jgi:hypothetical protein
MTWLAIVLAFQLGWYPTAQFQSYVQPDGYVTDSGQLYQQAEIKIVILEHLEVGGALNVVDFMVDRGTQYPSFHPETLDSTFFAHVLFGPLTIGWQHECLHPVVPWHSSSSFDAASDQFFLRVQLKWEWR